jgi:membrane-associated phospholipid phosphatase
MPKMIGEEPIKKVAVAAHQATQAESEPAPVRRYRAVLFRLVLVFIAIGFGILTFLVKTTPSFTIDLQITKVLQSLTFPSFSLLMSLTSWPGYVPQSMIIAGLMILVIYISGLHWEAVMALIASFFSTAINLLVKDLIQRARPTSDLANVYSTLTSYSFPSGHVMFYLGFFGFIVFLVFSILKPSLKRTLLMIFLSGMIVLIGMSRIYLGQHWASDVLGAYLLGSLVLAANIEFYLWGKPRFFVHQPVAAAEPQQPK